MLGVGRSMEIVTCGVDVVRRGLDVCGGIWKVE